MEGGGGGGGGGGWGGRVAVRARGSMMIYGQVALDGNLIAIT